MSEAKSNNSDLSALLTVESAYSDKCGFIGFRLTSEKETLLVFASRFASGVEGFRVNDKFTPGIGEKISYVTEKIGPQKHAEFLSCKICGHEPRIPEPVDGGSHKHYQAACNDCGIEVIKLSLAECLETWNRLMFKPPANTTED